MPIKLKLPNSLIIKACTEIAANARQLIIAAEAAQSFVASGMTQLAVQSLLESESHLHGERKCLELAAFVGWEKK